MRATKDSGVDWLGEIPADWEVRPCWSSFRRVKQTGFPEEELLSVYRDHGVVPKSSRDDNHNVESEDLTSYQLVRVGDMVMNKMKAWQGSIALSDHRGIVSPAYFVYRPTQEFSRKYFHYLLRSAPYVAHYNRISKGVRVGQWDLDPTYFRTTSLIVPPVEEQRRIADFLDRETAKIDALIAKQEELVTTLDERRQALITRAVTRGRNPKVRTKPTGLYWAPECPETWVVDKLSRHFRALKGNNAAQLTNEYCASVPGDFPVFSGQTSNDGVMAEIDTWAFERGEKGTLLATTVGSGQVMKIRRIFGKFSLSQNCMIIDAKTQVDPGFFRYQLEANFEATRGEQSSHMQTSFRMADLYGKKILIPPLVEQEHIATFLDVEFARIDRLIGAVSNTVVNLNERRQALISAAVTGKLEVGV